MEVHYFLLERLKFVRQLYETTTGPYIERKRKIEAEEEPFVPGYSVSEEPPFDEPPFLEKWIEAEESIEAVGKACISMVASSLHAYLQMWHKFVGVPMDDEMRGAFKQGWLNGYRAYFTATAQIDFHECPVDLGLLDELVLARNRTQHPEDITTDATSYSKADLQRRPRPFFVDESELDRIGLVDGEERGWLLEPRIKITPEKFERAVSEVKRFALWFEGVEGHR